MSRAPSTFEEWRDAVSNLPLTAINPTTPVKLSQVFSASGTVTSDQVQAWCSASGGTVDGLARALVRHAAARGHTPVSGYGVGAVVVEPGSGPERSRLHGGANFELEHGDLHDTVHAEQAAVSHALLAGASVLTDLYVTAVPCGHCRQFLLELMSAQALRIHVVQPDGAPPTPPQQLGDLQPAAFGPAHLGVAARIGSAGPPDRVDSSADAQADLLHGAGVNPEQDRELYEAACEAARRSHAPYSSGRVGVALRADGLLVRGARIESVAYNPTVRAASAALAHLTFRAGGTLPKLTAACLVHDASVPLAAVDAYRADFARVLRAAGLGQTP